MIQRPLSQAPLQPFLTRSELWVLGGHILLFVFAAAPLFLHLAPPFLDYHNHLARAYVIQNPAAFEGVYAVQWQIAPYILSDLTYQLFASLWPIYQAGQYFTVFCNALIVLGVVLISRKLHGRISAATLLVYFFIYNMAMILGLVNYLLGMGVALISFYLWLCVRDHRFAWPVLGIILLVNFFVHAISFGCLGLLIAAYEVLPLLRQPRQAAQRAGAVLAAALPCFIILLLAPRATLSGGTSWPDTQSMGLVFTASTAIAGGPELFLLSLLLPALWFAGVIKFREGFGGPVVLLAAFSFLLPHTLMGIVFFGIRLPIFLSFLVCAVTSFAGQRRIITAIVLTIMTLLGLYNFGALNKMIDECGAKHALFVKELAAIKLDPRQSIQVVNRSAAACELGGDVFYFAHAAVIDKQAFIPFLYTVIPPLKPAGLYADLHQTDVQAITYEAFMQQTAADHHRYRYVLVFDDQNRPNFSSRDFKLIGQGTFFKFYENIHYKP